MEGFEIATGRENIDPALLMRSDPSIARVMGQINLCTCFAGIYNGKNAAACLLNEQVGDGVCDVVNLAVADEFRGQGIYREMLLRVMDYAREKGFLYLEIGAGNADLDAHETLQKMGFRVARVIPDYFQSGGHSFVVQNGIVNRDQLHYRVDF